MYHRPNVIVKYVSVEDTVPENITSKDNRMDLGSILLFVFLLGRSQCFENFTTVGNSKMLIEERKLSFIEAEDNCKDMGSQLVEFWNEDEWKEVQTEHYT